MSVYVTFDDQPGDVLASNAGWGHVGDWIETLSPAEYPALFTLWDHGIYEPCSAVLAELRAAAKANAPDDATVVKTLAGLAAAIDGHDDPDDPVLTTTGAADAAALLALFGDKGRLNAAVSELTGGKDVKEERGPPPWPGAVFDAAAHRWKVSHPDGTEKEPSKQSVAEPTAAANPVGPAAAHVVHFDPPKSRSEFELAVAAAVGANPAISEKARAARAAVMTSVLRSMPDAAVQRLMKSVKSVRSCRNMAEVTDAFYDDGKTARPGADDDDAIEVWGFFDPINDQVAIDGGVLTSHEMHDELGVRGIYSHEFAHAVDSHPQLGWRAAFSAEPEFREAWGEELADGQLCEYAASDVKEGFAEFGRLLWGSDIPHETIREKFPKTWAVFHSHGLV